MLAPNSSYPETKPNSHLCQRFGWVFFKYPVCAFFIFPPVQNETLMSGPYWELEKVHARDQEQRGEVDGVGKISFAAVITWARETAITCHPILALLIFHCQVEMTSSVKTKNTKCIHACMITCACPLLRSYPIHTPIKPSCFPSLTSSPPVSHTGYANVFAWVRVRVTRVSGCRWEVISLAVWQRGIIREV